MNLNDICSLSFFLFLSLLLSFSLFSSLGHLFVEATLKWSKWNTTFSNELFTSISRENLSIPKYTNIRSLPFLRLVIVQFAYPKIFCVFRYFYSSAFHRSSEFLSKSEYFHFNLNSQSHIVIWSGKNFSLTFKSEYFKLEELVFNAWFGNFNYIGNRVHRFKSIILNVLNVYSQLLIVYSTNEHESS